MLLQQTRFFLISVVTKLFGARYAFYFMEANAYLGQCLVIVYHPSLLEKYWDSLTGQNVVIIVKGRKLSRNFSSRDIDLKKLLATEVFDTNHQILLRISSECMFGVYGDTHCDCERQRLESLAAIRTAKQGIYVHLPQEGQGRGLLYKAKELSLQVSGHDEHGKFRGPQSIVAAGEMLLGHSNIDVRHMFLLRHVFADLELNKFSFTFITGNPNKVHQVVHDVGLRIDATFNPARHINKHNVSEYLGKIYKKGYRVTDEEFEEILQILKVERELPVRAKTMLRFLQEDIRAGKTLPLSHEMRNKLLLISTNVASFEEAIIPAKTDIIEET